MRTERNIREEIKRLEVVIANLKPGYDENDGIFIHREQIPVYKSRYLGLLYALKWVLETGKELPFTDPIEEEKPNQ